MKKFLQKLVHATALGWMIASTIFPTDVLATGRFLNGAASSDGDGTYADPYKLMATANDAMQPGDTLYVAAWGSTYDEFPNPYNAGTSSAHIVYMGDSSAYNKVVVPGGTMDKAYVDRYGMRFTSGIDDYYPSPNTGGIIGKCNVWGGGLTLRGGSQLLRNTLVGSDSANARFAVNPIVNTQGDNITIQDCTFKLRTASDDYSTMFRLEPDDKSDRIQGLRYYRNTATIEIPDGDVPGHDAKFFFFNRLKNSHIVASTFNINDSCGYNPAGGLVHQYLVYRDGLDSVFTFNTTVNALTERTGTGAGTISLTGSGNSLTGTGPNTFRWCTFKNYTSGAPGVFYQWQMQNGDSLTHCTIIDSSSAVNDAGFLVTGVNGNAYIYRCDFINLAGTGGAFRIGSNVGLGGGRLDVKGCAFYTRSTSTSAEMYAARYFPASAGNVTSDYNNFGHIATSRAIRTSAGGVTGVGTGTIPCTTYGWDCNSIQRAPCFTDSVGDNWNLIPIGHVGSTTNWMVGAGYAGTTIGAYDTTSATADVTAPSAISDLSASTGAATAGSIDLAWTAPGDDAGSGTATSYDIRYSTALITAGNFSSATQYTAPPFPAVAGTVQYVSLLGLGGGTNYYVAIKTTDESSNTSTISNVVHAVAKRAGGGGGGDIPE